MTAVDSLHRGYWRPTLADCRAVAGPGTEHGFVFPLRRSLSKGRGRTSLGTAIGEVSPLSAVNRPGLDSEPCAVAIA